MNWRYNYEKISNRGIELVTQVANRRMLTVEDYLKWYDYFVIEPRGGDYEVVLLSKLLELPLENGKAELIYDVFTYEERDHCTTPRGFVKLAEILGLKYDYRTYLAVINMYNENVCDFDYCIEEDGSSVIATFEEYPHFIGMVSDYCCGEEIVKKNCTDWGCFCSS